MAARAGRPTTAKPPPEFKPSLSALTTRRLAILRTDDLGEDAREVLFFNHEPVSAKECHVFHNHLLYGIHRGDVERVRWLMRVAPPSRLRSEELLTAASETNEGGCEATLLELLERAGIVLTAPLARRCFSVHMNRKEHFNSKLDLFRLCLARGASVTDVIAPPTRVARTEYYAECIMAGMGVELLTLFLEHGLLAPSNDFEAMKLLKQQRAHRSVYKVDDLGAVDAVPLMSAALARNHPAADVLFPFINTSDDATIWPALLRDAMLADSARSNPLTTWRATMKWSAMRVKDGSRFLRDDRQSGIFIASMIRTFLITAQVADPRGIQAEICESLVLVFRGGLKFNQEARDIIMPNLQAGRCAENLMQTLMNHDMYFCTSFTNLEYVSPASTPSRPFIYEPRWSPRLHQSCGLSLGFRRAVRTILWLCCRNSANDASRPPVAVFDDDPSTPAVVNTRAPIGFPARGVGPSGTPDTTVDDIPPNEPDVSRKYKSADGKWQLAPARAKHMQPHATPAAAAPASRGGTAVRGRAVTNKTTGKSSQATRGRGAVDARKAGLRPGSADSRRGRAHPSRGRPQTREREASEATTAGAQEPANALNMWPLVPIELAECIFDELYFLTQRGFSD